MKPNNTTYPLAFSGERFKRIAEIVNPLMVESCGTLDVDGKRNALSWEAVPVDFSDEVVRFLLKSFADDDRYFIGVELNGDIYSPDAAKNVKWFTFHKPGRAPVYRATSMDAMIDPKAWVPPEFNWTYENSEENPGHMHWSWWSSSVRNIEEGFEREGISHDGWNASPGRCVLLEDTSRDKTVIICKNEETGRHLGFVQIQYECCVELQSPFILSGGIFCFFASITDALAHPQDAMPDHEIGRYTEQALKTWKCYPFE